MGKFSNILEREEGAPAAVSGSAHPGRNFTGRDRQPHFWRTLSLALRASIFTRRPTLLLARSASEWIFSTRSTFPKWVMAGRAESSYGWPGICTPAPQQFPRPPGGDFRLDR